MVSFDVTFFTRVPIRKALNYLIRQSEEDAPSFLHYALTFFIFCFGARFFEQIDSVVIGSQLFPIIATFLMEDFEDFIVIRAIHKPHAGSSMWKTSVIWPHIPEKLKNFLIS